MNAEKELVEMIIPFKTPSINHLYGQHGFHKYLKPEAKKLREQINQIVQKIGVSSFSSTSGPFKITVEIYEDWYTKNGEVKKKDISNREKFLIDSVFEALNIDDKMIFEHTMRKIQSNEEKAVIKIINLVRGYQNGWKDSRLEKE